MSKEGQSASSGIAKALHTSIVSTMIHLGFCILRTKNLEDTAKWLRRIHHRLMDTDVEIPLFLSPKFRRKRGQNQQDVEQELGLTFSHPPILPPQTNEPGSERRRHSLYDELKAEIEYTRERGTRTIHALFRAQLKQVDSMSVGKVNGVTQVYRTPSALLSAYGDLEGIIGGETAAQEMVQDLALTVDGERSMRVGPKSSLELSRVYTAQMGDAPSKLHASHPKLNESQSFEANNTTFCDSKPTPNGFTATATALETNKPPLTSESDNPDVNSSESSVIKQPKSGDPTASTTSKPAIATRDGPLRSKPNGAISTSSTKPVLVSVSDAGRESSSNSSELLEEPHGHNASSTKLLSTFILTAACCLSRF